jgi:hypothetical protein
MGYVVIGKIFIKPCHRIGESQEYSAYAESGNLNYQATMSLRLELSDHEINYVSFVL